MATRGRGDWNFGSAQEYTAGGLRRGSKVGITRAEEEEDLTTIKAPYLQLYETAVPVQYGTYNKYPGNF